MHVARSILLLALAALVPAAISAAEPEAATRPGGPWQRVPELRALTEWVTFGLSFDGGTLEPEMALGESRGQRSPAAEFAPGLAGRAVRIGGRGDGAWGVYPKAGNFPIARRGALSLWICPLNWNHRDDGYTSLVTTNKGGLILERQGPAYARDGKLLRGEALLAILIARETGNISVAAECDHWSNGQWHLIAVNWSWPRLELSVDGGPLSGKAAKEPPRETVFGDLRVGSAHGPATLVDELFIYGRPLAEAEIKAIWEAARAEEVRRGR
jgi:hypothetical protein